MKMTWIEDVFVHDGSVYTPRHCMQTKDLPAVKADWQKAARELQTKTGADSVVYCTVEYDEDDTPVEVNLYMIALSSNELQERTDGAIESARKKGRTMWIGAVHKH